MSVWQNTPPTLSGREGELVSVSISVEPRELESLLEALAIVSFPINPQICHGPETVVEFPAYEGGLADVRQVLQATGFDPRKLRVTSMIEELHALAG